MKISVITIRYPFQRCELLQQFCPADEVSFMGGKAYGKLCKGTCKDPVQTEILPVPSAIF
jgi:hypothetical protein